jgi:hypothetical protein
MMWLEAIVSALLKWFEGLSRKDTIGQDAKKQDDLKKHLLDRVDRHEQRMRDKGDHGSPR